MPLTMPSFAAIILVLTLTLSTSTILGAPSAPCALTNPLTQNLTTPIFESVPPGHQNLTPLLTSSQSLHPPQLRLATSNRHRFRSRRPPHRHRSDGPARCVAAMADPRVQGTAVRGFPSVVHVCALEWAGAADVDEGAGAVFE